MRRPRVWHATVLVLAMAGMAAAQSATELKKELFPKWKKAQAEGKDLGEAGKLYKEGDEALKQGLQEEALDLFQQAKDAWPDDAS
jgi:hypothetical protein